MRSRQIMYKCDCCGRELYVDNSANQLFDPEDSDLPDGWYDLSSAKFGEICDRCYEEFAGLYERIHAPMKAKEISKNAF